MKYSSNLQKYTHVKQNQNIKIKNKSKNNYINIGWNYSEIIPLTRYF